jgi:hypothetical protein
MRKQRVARRSRVGATGLALLAGALLAACGTATPVWIATLADGSPNAQHPAQVALTGGGRVVLKDLRWSAWGNATATATGTLIVAQSCVPNCAIAQHKVYAVQVQATAIKLCRGLRAYTQLTTISGTFKLKVPMCRAPLKG